MVWIAPLEFCVYRGNIEHTFSSFLLYPLLFFFILFSCLFSSFLQSFYFYFDYLSLFLSLVRYIQPNTIVYIVPNIGHVRACKIQSSVSPPHLFFFRKFESFGWIRSMVNSKLRSGRIIAHFGSNGFPI